MEINQEHELKFSVDQQLQAKFVAKLDGDAREELLAFIKNQFGFGDFSVRDAGREEITDEYFDTADNSLDEVHGCLRVRQKSGTRTLTVKRLAGQDRGEFRRAELNCAISEFDYHTFVARGTLDFDPIRVHVADLDGARLVRRLRVANGRTKFILEKQGGEYELCLDQYCFIHPETDARSEEQFEIEIEAMNSVASDRLSDLRRQLGRVLEPHFKAAPTSKYERGMQWVKGQGPVQPVQSTLPTVFLAHGRDVVFHQVARFLESRGYRVIVLSELPDLGSTVIEKLEHASNVAAAVVLLTADDEGRLRQVDAPLKARARQNVVFELGFFTGRLGRSKVCILHRGDVELPSDYAGVITIELDHARGWERRLEEALVHAAGRKSRST